MSNHTTGDGRIPERQKKNSKLKRIMSVSGSYGLRNYTVKDLQNLKGKKNYYSKNIMCLKKISI